MKFSLGTVLVATLALTYPIQAKNVPKNGRYIVPAVDEASSYQDGVVSHKKAVTTVPWFSDRASKSVTPSANISRTSRHHQATQRSRSSEAPNEGNSSKQPSSTTKNDDQGTESTGYTKYSSNQSNSANTISHPSNTLVSSETSRSNQPGPSTTHTTSSSKLPTSNTGGSSGTSTPSRPPQGDTGSDSATSSNMPEPTGSPSTTITHAPSKSHSTINSSMAVIIPGGHTTSEAVVVPIVTTVAITKGQETSSAIFTATSVTTSEDSEPTAAWGCASVDICGVCLVPLLCPLSLTWGLIGGWVPVNPLPGGPIPLPAGGPMPPPLPLKPPVADTATSMTTSTTTTSSTSSTTPASTLRLCMSIIESGSVEATSTPMTSSAASTSATPTTTPVSTLRLCMSVVESGSVTATSAPWSVTSSARASGSFATTLATTTSSAITRSSASTTSLTTTRSSAITRSSVITTSSASTTILTTTRSSAITRSSVITTSSAATTSLATTTSLTITTSSAVPMPPPEVSINAVAPRGDGTTIHNEVGCISVNGQILCNSWTQSAIRTDSDTTTVKIYAKVDGGTSDHVNIQPGCELTASWPSSYGDVYYKADDCLYDAQDNPIQCCTQPTTDTVPNPYAPICRRSYEFLWDTFTIWSEDWITDDGLTLHAAVMKCGIVTDWSASRTGDKNTGKGYEVVFDITLQANNCVGKAIYNSGGPAVNC